MKNKSRNIINNNITSLQNETDISKIRLRPIKIHHKKKLFINSSQTDLMNNLTKNIPVSLFHDNEVNIVRNLNLYNDNNFCEQIYFKKNLERNMINDEELLNGSNNKISKVNLPKIKNITMDSILESEKRMNLNKKISMRNMANNQLEKELYENLKDIKKRINDLKNRKFELYKNFQLRTKQIRDINFEMETLGFGKSETFLNNIFDLSDKSLSRNNSKKSISKSLGGTPLRLGKKSRFLSPERKESKYQKQLIKTLWGKNDYDDKIQVIKMLYIAKKMNDEKKAENEKNLKQYKEDIEQINKELKKIREELSNLKEKENTSAQKLMRHYESLLYQGRDTRNDGLIWIIKSMWKLGRNVPMQYIPKFLDFHAIEFLFKLANKSIELENSKNLLNKNKKDLTLKIHKLYFINNDHNTDVNNFTKKPFGGKSKRT